MSNGNWIEDLVLKRRAQRSNAYIVESVDPRRVQQFLQLLKSGKFGELVKVSYERLLVYDLQRNSLVDLMTGTPLNLDPMSSLVSQLDVELQSRPAVLVVNYVFMQSHADMLSNMLAAWSHDEKLYKNKSTVVVFTSSATLFSDSLRRLIHTITIVPSTAEERRVLLVERARELSEAFEVKYGKKLRVRVTEEIVEATSGLTLHDVETAALESFFINRRFDVATFTDYKIQLLKNYGMEYVIPSRGFESVGGYHLLKRYVQSRVIALLRNPDKAKYYGLSVPRGILLYGYPGSGKSWFTKCLAKEIGLPMLKLSPADLLRGIVGETEARVRQLTQLMESLAPIVIFLDEYDQLAMSRGQQFIGDSGVSRRMQNMLLDWLGDERRRSFVVGATNYVEACDFAFLRVGRIDKIILVLPPDLKAREEILKVHTSVVRKVPVRDVDFAALAERTPFWTGAELERLVLDAAANAMDVGREYVMQGDFDEALSLTEVNIQERLKRVREMVGIAKRLENVDTAFLKAAVEEFVATEKDKSRIEGLMEAL